MATHASTKYDPTHERQQRWAERNPEKRREINARAMRKSQQKAALARFGMTEADRLDMLAKQDGGCAICGRPDGAGGRRLAIDHETNVVRGLLCSECNMGLGKLGDTVECLTAALAYLKGER